MNAPKPAVELAAAAYLRDLTAKNAATGRRLSVPQSIQDDLDAKAQRAAKVVAGLVDEQLVDDLDDLFGQPIITIDTRGLL